MEMKNKILVGLLLVAQVSSIMTKGEGMGGYDSYSPALQKELATIKAEGRTYQAQLKADYATYVQNVKSRNKMLIEGEVARQMAYAKEYPNKPIKQMVIMGVLTEADWFRYGRPQR